MKFLKALALIAVVATAPAFAGQKAELKTKLDSISYTVGTNWGSMMKTDSLFLNLDALTAGISDALHSQKLALSEEQIAAYFKELSTMVQERKQKAQEILGAKAKEEGAKFLAENGKRKGVTTTPSGLQYEVLTPGKTGGKKPTATSNVKVHYLGTLINGKKFDSSYDRKEPIEFELNRVIPGWTEGVQLMTEGAKYKFYVPSELGYGVRGTGQDIGPNETLIFEVELLEVKSNPKM